MQHTRTAPVVVGVDGSEESKPALRWAVEYARMSGAPLHALMAWDLPVSYGIPATYVDVDFETQAETMMADTVAAVVGDSVAVTHRVEPGHPAAVLVTASEQARLRWSVPTVMGASLPHCSGRLASSASTTPIARSSWSAAKPTPKRTAS